MPLTFLPPRFVFGAWLSLAFAGWYLSLRWAHPSLALTLLIAPLTFYGAWVGNVQSILIALLIPTLRGRLGPVVVGVAASLKIAPIFLAVQWAGRGEWRKALIATCIAIALAAPALLYGIATSPFGLPPEISLRASSPVLWAVVALAAIGLAYRLAKTRYGRLASAVAVLAVRPALLSYDVGYLLTALPSTSRGMVNKSNIRSDSSK